MHFPAGIFPTLPGTLWSVNWGCVKDIQVSLGTTFSVNIGIMVPTWPRLVLLLPPALLCGWSCWRVPSIDCWAAPAPFPAGPEIYAAGQSLGKGPEEKTRVCQSQSTHRHTFPLPCTLCFPQILGKKPTTHRLCSREGDLSHLAEEEHPGNGGNHVHDEVIIHHVTGVHLQPLQVVRDEHWLQLGTADGWGGQGKDSKVRSVLQSCPGSQCLAFTQVFNIFLFLLTIHVGFAVKEVCPLAAAENPSKQHRH